ncbi:MAG: M48 family metallopeptidase [candidate division FCPU426 bacterium]
MKRLALFGLLLAGMMVWAGCSTVPLTGRNRLELVSSSEVSSLGAQNYKELMGQAKLSQNAVEVAKLRRVGQRVALAAEAVMRENGMAEEIPNYQWEFNLVQDDATINAFCMPGGKVAFYTGILPVCQDEAGLAVVMGHEVAHALAKHGNERMSQQLLVELGGAALSTALKEKPEKTQNLFMLAYGVGTTVGVVLPYSRSHEYEADRIGLQLMARAGYDPRLAAPFWERMAQKGGGGMPEFLSTHPVPANRIENLKALEGEALPFYERGQVK